MTPDFAAWSVAARYRRCDRHPLLQDPTSWYAAPCEAPPAVLGGCAVDFGHTALGLLVGPGGRLKYVDVCFPTMDDFRTWRTSRSFREMHTGMPRYLPGGASSGAGQLVLDRSTDPG